MLATARLPSSGKKPIKTPPKGVKQKQGIRCRACNISSRWAAGRSNRRWSQRLAGWAFSGTWPLNCFETDGLYHLLGRPGGPSSLSLGSEAYWPPRPLPQRQLYALHDDFIDFPPLLEGCLPQALIKALGQIQARMNYAGPGAGGLRAALGRLGLGVGSYCAWARSKKRQYRSEKSPAVARLKSVASAFWRFLPSESANQRAMSS
jgi:hypothetical protein